MKLPSRFFPGILPFWGVFFFGISVHAQSNIRAWHAQGQVWIVWQTSAPLPQSYIVYKNATAFNQTSQATPIGRLFQIEYLPAAFVQQTGDQDFTWSIPTPDGNTYKLAKGEALFVETVTAAGEAFYAVVQPGQASVIAGVNRTQNAVLFGYDPVNDPVSCHLQYTGVLNTGHKTRWYSLWALGKQQHWSGRPDFPVMANAFKNGMPSLFIVSEAVGMDTSGGKKIPMTHWFHGGGGFATQTTANRYKFFNIEPQQGISVSHNDDFAFLFKENGDTVLTSGRTLWLGWSKSHNPFNINHVVSPFDTVVNYTQRRILWINDWLVRRYNVDPQRVALQGYSMGSGGAHALAKTWPDRFSTASLFNCGFRGAEEEGSQMIVGAPGDNIPTSLKRKGAAITVDQMFELNTPVSDLRDYPLIRVWMGKNDDNGRMRWGPDLVKQLRAADSLGWGIQTHWDERQHTYPSLGFHWIEAEAANQQTYRDNLSYQEFFRADRSFPAFFNHRLEANNNDPGVGKLGVHLGDGDDWGTWGGYHNWDFQNMIDMPGKWEATAWLTWDALFDHDKAPVTALTADMAIRKPQGFKPAPGKILHWTLRNQNTGAVIKSGVTTVQANGMVVLQGVTVPREDLYRVVITVADPSVGVSAPEPEALSFFPNPVRDILHWPDPLTNIRIFDAAGRLAMHYKTGDLTEADVRGLIPGFYFMEAYTNEGRRKFAKFFKNGRD